MQLLYPYFLVAGLVLVIPIIIHLFNLRKYKTVYYSDTSLLEEIVLKSKKKKTLKELLVLLTRLVFLMALVIAFAYPFFGDEQETKSSNEVVLLDNSQSAAVFTEGNEVFQQEKELMYKVYESKKNVRFLSNDIKVLNPLDQEGLFDLINQSEITTHQLAIKEINELISLNENTDALTVFSPFSNAFDLDQLQSSKQDITLVHFDTKDVAKIVIDSLWLNQLIQQGNEPTTVKINYLTYGEAHEYDIKLFVNGELRGSKEVIEKTGQVEFKTHFSKSSNQAVIKCYNEQGQEVSAFYFVVREKQQYQVTLIGMDNNVPLARAFNDKEDFDLYEFGSNQVDFEKTLSSDLVFVKYNKKNQGAYSDVLSQLLKKDIKVCLFFDNEIDKEILRSFSINNKRLGDSLKARIQQPNSKLYTGVFLNNKVGVVDLPQVSRKNVLTGLLTPLLKNEFNETVIAQSITEPNLFISTENLSETSSFTGHSLFIPTVYQFLFFENLQKRLFLRPNTYFDLPSSFKIKNTVDLIRIGDSSVVKLDAIKQGESQLLLLDESLASGWYQLHSDSAQLVIAVNERVNKSSFTYHSLEELEALVAEKENINVVSSQVFGDQTNKTMLLQTGYPLWKYLVLVALLFLCFEMMILNFQSGNRFKKNKK